MGFDFLKNKQSLLTRGVLLLLALTFIIGFGYIGGVNIGGLGGSAGTAVEVNGEKVPYAQFKNLRDALQRQYSQNLDELPPEILDFIKFSALNNIVELKLLSQKAKELGLKISDNELADAIKSSPAFQVDGVFVGKESYENFINQRLNQTVGEFEKSYKDELLARKLVSIINESAIVTEEQLLNLYKMQNEEIKLNYISFSPDEFTASVNPSDGEINNYYNENKNNFQTEEKRNIEYSSIDPSSFSSRIKLSDEELKAYYDAYADEFTVDGTLKPFEEAKIEIENELKKTKIVAAYDDFISNFSNIKAGSLENLSTEFPLGKIEKAGFISRNDPSNEVPKKVTEKAFSMKKGDVSLASENSTSWIIELLDIEDKKDKELSSVKDEITAVLKREKAKNAARVSADESLKKFQNSNSNFLETAEKISLDIKETAFYNRIKGPNEINSGDITLESFGLNKENPLLPKVYNSGDEFIIASLKERKEVQTEDFENNKFSLKEQEISRLRREILDSWLDKIRSQAKIVPNKNLFPAQG
ncbi:MAG: SurA N-terminal domain-containing protein [Thermodesulfobacteriota bacterium]